MEPTLAISIHYNVLPDNGNALTTGGVGVFCYHGQSHGLAQYLHDILTNRSPPPTFLRRVLE
jgi:N-acetylmuramoyl-L-alanine amidase